MTVFYFSVQVAFERLDLGVLFIYWLLPGRSIANAESRAASNAPILYFRVLSNLAKKFDSIYCCLLFTTSL